MAASDWAGAPESGSKLTALQTLRDEHCILSLRTQVKTGTIPRLGLLPAAFAREDLPHSQHVQLVFLTPRALLEQNEIGGRQIGGRVGAGSWFRVIGVGGNRPESHPEMCDVHSHSLPQLSSSSAGKFIMP